MTIVTLLAVELPRTRAGFCYKMEAKEVILRLEEGCHTSFHKSNKVSRFQVSGVRFLDNLVLDT